MIIVSHRRNTRQQLRETPAELGVEIDVRSKGGELILNHDAFIEGERFDDWIEAYRHRLLILNVKEEGLEGALLERMARYRIEDFFFLDQSFPFLVRTALAGERRCAVRASEYESLDTALALAGKVEWVWVDCFTRFPLDRDGASRLKQAGFRLCLVSPELQGRTTVDEIRSMRVALDREAIEADAVCTKIPEQWR